MLWLFLVNCRHEDEDVLNIQPPQVQAQPRKEKHRRRHKEGRKKGKEDRYVDDIADRHSSRKTERQSGTDVSRCQPDVKLGSKYQHKTTIHCFFICSIVSVSYFWLPLPRGVLNFDI